VLPLFSIDERGCECRRGCTQPGKHPRVMGGAHAASIDPGQVREWWRMWPTSNLGIGCADLIVYDIDPRNDGEETFENAIGGRPFPRVPTVCTGSGGLHLYFAGPGRSGHLGEGVDIQAAGKLAVAPPSVHASGARYTWLVYDIEPVPVPQYLLPRERALAPADLRPGQLVDVSPRYIRAAFEGELEVVRTAPEGRRNDSLNTSVLKISRFVGPGKLDASAVVASFRDAAHQAGLAGPEVDATIRSALVAGGVLS
jgi:hypothetical protein